MINRKIGAPYNFNFFSTLLAIVLSLMAFTGCAKNNGSVRLNQEQAATIKSLNLEIKRLNAELQAINGSKQDLSKAKAELEDKLEGEMASGNLSVSMQDRGLVVTVLDRILFDSGKAELKPSSESTLEKVADILQEKAKDHMIYVEGHTDSEPIRRSGWRSNWELSTARATEVVHYFTENKNLDPERLAATGYGEFHPVMDNESLEGRVKNRRVEIVVSPKQIGN